MTGAPGTSAAEASKVITGTLVDFPDGTPRLDTNGALVIGGDGRLVWRGSADALPADYANVARTDYRDCLVLPGLIDAHLHYPQIRMLGAAADGLLDWLNRYTFIEEQRFADPDIARPLADAFCDELLDWGITSALAFASSSPTSVDSLFESAATRGMAMVTGKTCMDRNAPPGLCDTARSAYDDSQVLIQRHHGNGRNRYAITPRFAITSTPEQLDALGTLASENPGLVIQTHMSETQEEIETVRSLFPDHADYLDVYDQFGLVTDMAVFAHVIHPTDRERGRLAETGASVVHCPTSNTFLGSGLCDVTGLSSEIAVGVGCDIGGGTGFSPFHTLQEAYKVAMLRGTRMSASDLFARATKVNARLLGLEGEIGVLEPGSWADIAVFDPVANRLLALRNRLSETVEDQLFALMFLADKAAVRAVYVAGEQRR